jgi:hypothetical protein
LNIVPSGGGSPAQLTVTGDYAYSDLADTTKWTTFDVSTVNPNAKGFSGGAFDGRYVYFAPYQNGNNLDGVAARYDTHAPLNVGTSWSIFDVSSRSAAATGFAGAAFDGRYVYLVPSGNSVVMRYDPQSAFDAGTSWTPFDLGAGSGGFGGAVFDGRLLYFVPNSNANGLNGEIEFYDTLGSFTSGTSWGASSLTASVDPNAKGFWGGVFDGRYLYLVPALKLFVRYDTQGGSPAWSKFDISATNSAVSELSGGAFDGKYVYYAPNANGVVVRYNTATQFDVGSSWETFNATSVNASASGFVGAAFDGRYVYFVPNATGAGADGVVLRYDSLGSFTMSNAWSAFDVSSTNPSARGFGGAIFDGRYLYFVPDLNGGGTWDGVVARFDAKQPPLLTQLCPDAPALYCDPGSFF